MLLSIPGLYWARSFQPLDGGRASPGCLMRGVYAPMFARVFALRVVVCLYTVSFKWVTGWLAAWPEQILHARTCVTSCRKLLSRLFQTCRMFFDGAANVRRQLLPERHLFIAVCDAFAFLVSADHVVIAEMVNHRTCDGFNDLPSI